MDINNQLPPDHERYIEYILIACVVLAILYNYIQ
jgi:hypothetical protein